MSIAASEEKQRRLRRGASQLRKEYSANEVANLLNYSPRTIRRWTAEPRDEYLERVRARRESVLKLHDEGKTPREIIKETGYSRSSVYTILRELS